jgi:hypothetical protein
MARQHDNVIEDDGGTGAFQDYHLTTEDNGSIVGNCVTNDNHDLGVPNEYAEWSVRYRNYKRWCRGRGYHTSVYPAWW